MAFNLVDTKVDCYGGPLPAGPGLKRMLCISSVVWALARRLNVEVQSAPEAQEEGTKTADRTGMPFLTHSHERY